MLVHLSHACHKLYELTSSNRPYVWTEEHDKAFYAVKDMLSKEILNNSFDPDKQSTVIFDANKFTICAVLIQEGKVISCVSRCLNKHQRNWATIERELFAFTYSLKKSRINSARTFLCWKKRP